MVVTDPNLDGHVASRGGRRSRHGVRQDAGAGRKPIENDAIQFGGEGSHLILEITHGDELVNEICDGGVDARLPGAEIGGRLLDGEEAVEEGGLKAVDTGLH